MAAEALDYDLDGHQVRLTSPTKEYFPGVATKADIADYLVAVAPQMLQTLGGRPTTMERWPGGIEGEPFYQKRTP
ncbi:ATP-dependent DNA ligase, partial [Streptomyces sp. P9(2023)]|nr:ATP-dependent DNA ligase [Streptomyces sp. P9(2023)]